VAVEPDHTAVRPSHRDVEPTSEIVPVLPEAQEPAQPSSHGATTAVLEEEPAAEARTLRLTAQTVTRMLALAGEAVVATRWFEPFAGRLGALKRQVADAAGAVEQLVEEMARGSGAGTLRHATLDVQRHLEHAHTAATELSTTLDAVAVRQEALASRLYNELQATRLRPFSDLVEPLPRIVRDLARELGKEVEFTIEGARTLVDRDVAAVLESPLIHVIRNAIDHGIEPPTDRMARGKPARGQLTIRAWHRSGMLRIEVVDDGRGVDVEDIRTRVVAGNLADAALASRLAEQELLSFLFLPGFTTSDRVTQVSGRGVGLDAVSTAVKSIGGRVGLVSRPGHGLTLRLDVPVTLSLQRALLIDVDGEPYAVPLTRVERVEQVARSDIRLVEGREYLSTTLLTSSGTDGLGGPGAPQERHVGLVSARQLLDAPIPETPGDTLPVVVIRAHDSLYGLVVDRVMGEHTIVVRPLDTRLGKVPTIAAAGMGEDGAPLLVIDVDDLVRSIDAVLGEGRLARIDRPPVVVAARRARRVLVVDDSITVREVERQLLESRGYSVEVAVDGIDGWNAVRAGHYDLVVTDVDMPRLDGIGLVERIRADSRLAALPVMVVSYKDREEDRLRGLDAGASYYLTKASFQDETFLRAVDELIGDVS
jgi:two-component system sensor histidine kinase and response regulator WspE